MSEIKKVVIIGAEETGAKIGDLLSKAGVKVVLEKKDFTEELSDADVIIEALPSLVLQPKKEALRKCDKQAPPRAILVTTGSGGVTEIAAATRRRERVIGLNFIFNPLEKEKCLVQIVKGLETSEETVNTCQSLVGKTGAASVIVQDLPGLIVERTIASLINEAAIMYTTHVAAIEDMDRIAKLCLNWPMGPFEFADHIGIDKVVATLEDASRDGTQYLPCRLLRQMVVSGQLGKKTGKGFYTYS